MPAHKLPCQSPSVTFAKFIPRSALESRIGMAASRKDVVDGVFAIDKPPGISSAQVIRDLQHQYFDKSQLFAAHLAWERSKRQSEARTKYRNKRDAKPQHVKMGHGGTLDPLATGVLILGVGDGTKCLPGFLGCKKTYETTVVFGASTDTYDISGKTVNMQPCKHITKDSVVEALAKFRGRFMQRPPVYSAKWINGKRAYDIARAGGELPEMKEKEVEVDEMELVEWLQPESHSFQIPEHATSDIKPRDGSADESVEGRSMKRKRKQALANADTADSTQLPSTKLAKSAAAEDTLVTRPSTSGQDDIAPDLTIPVSEPETNPPRAGDEESQPIKDQASKHQQSASQIFIDESAAEPPDTASENVHSTSGRDASRNNPSVSIVKQGNEEPTMSGALRPPSPTLDSTLPSPYTATLASKPPAARIRMTVSSGFYVRSLCHDLGIAVGSAGFMATLVRSKQGDFVLGKNVMEFKDFRQAEDGEEGWGKKLRLLLNEWNRAKGEEKTDTAA